MSRSVRRFGASTGSGSGWGSKTGQSCKFDGTCASVGGCTPDCTGKACGGDGCGGTCGACASGQSCKFDGTCVTAATPRRTSLPGSGGTWLWPTSVLLQRTTTAGGSTVVVLAQRMRSTGSGAWSFARVGASSVVLTVAPHGAVTIGRAHDLPASDVLWGAGSVVRGATTYLYGTRVVHQPLVMGRDLLVARAPTARVTDPTTWSYRTAAGWSTRAADAAVVLPAASGVSTNPAVVVVDGRYRVVTKPQEYLDDRVVELTSSTPYGPWTSRLLFRSPSTAATRARTVSPRVRWCST